MGVWVSSVSPPRLGIQCWRTQRCWGRVPMTSSIGLPWLTLASWPHRHKLPWPLCWTALLGPGSIWKGECAAGMCWFLFLCITFLPVLNLYSLDMCVGCTTEGVMVDTQARGMCYIPPFWSSEHWTLFVMSLTPQLEVYPWSTNMIHYFVSPLNIRTYSTGFGHYLYQTVCSRLPVLGVVSPSWTNDGRKKKIPVLPDELFTKRQGSNGQHHLVPFMVTDKDG